MDFLKRSCDVCGTVNESVRRCTGCYRKYYCSRSCQKTDWALHKRYCKTIRQEGKGTRSSMKKREADHKTSNQKCSYCASESNLMICSRCKMTNYCSKTCQKLDWWRHKHDCKEVTKSKVKNEIEKTSKDISNEEHRNRKEEQAAVEGIEQKGNCLRCGVFGVLKTCTGCKVAQYCSKGCQREDWNKHKLNCKSGNKGANQEANPEDVIETKGFKRYQYDDKKSNEREERNNWSSARNNWGSAFVTKNYSGPFSRFFMTLSPEKARIYATRPPGSLVSAKKQAARKCPGKIILDDFNELPHELFLMFSRRNTVLIAFMFRYHEHVMRHGVYLKDKHDSITRVEFYLDHLNDNPAPFFSYEDITPGNYICLENA